MDKIIIEGKLCIDPVYAIASDGGEFVSGYEIDVHYESLIEMLKPMDGEEVRITIETIE